MKRAYLTILVAFAWLILGGLLLLGIAALVLDPKVEEPPSWFLGAGILLILGFIVVFLIGTARWARAKGYASLLGVILGWIGPLGLVVLVLLPDRSVASAPPRIPDV